MWTALNNCQTSRLSATDSSDQRHLLHVTRLIKWLITNSLSFHCRPSWWIDSHRFRCYPFKVEMIGVMNWWLTLRLVANCRVAGERRLHQLASCNCISSRRKRRRRGGTELVDKKSSEEEEEPEEKKKLTSWRFQLENQFHNPLKSKRVVVAMLKESRDQVAEHLVKLGNTLQQPLRSLPGTS